jgi:two-component system sensor histidine kinase HydH
MGGDRGAPGSPTRVGSKGGEEDEATRLALALCHEIGNLVGAVRLQAHLLDSEHSPKELAVASVEVEDLCARSSALLSLMRPLVSRVSRRTYEGVVPAAILNALQFILEDCGGRGVVVSVECREGLPGVAVDPDTMQQMLLTLAFGAMEAARPKGRVGIRALPGKGPDEVCFAVEDDGPDDELGDWSQQMLRGRPLVCAVASRMVTWWGGRLEVGRSDGVTRVALIVPAG